MAHSESSHFPVEIVELIVDEIGKSFIDRTGPDYQRPALRTSLYNLSLSARRLRDYCRNYLWHALVVECTYQNECNIPGDYHLYMESLYQTLLAHDSPLPCVKRLELHFRGRPSNMQTKPRPYVPKILGVFRQLESLHLDGKDAYAIIPFNKGQAMSAIEPCIQGNPLRELSIHHAHLHADFISLLPTSLKRLVLKEVDVVDWEHLLSIESETGPIASLESIALQVTDRYWESRVSTLPPTFFESLRSLDVEIRGIYTFHNLHQQLLLYCHNLETLRIGYSDTSGDDWKNWIDLLTSIHKQIPISQRLTKLTLEAKNFHSTDGLYPFQRVVDAYLGLLNLPQSLIELELRATSYNCEFIRLAPPITEWSTAGRILSDEERFPNLKRICVEFKEIYWLVPKHLRDAIEDRIPQRQAEKLEEVKSAFLEAQRHGVDLDISWTTELEGL